MQFTKLGYYSTLTKTCQSCKRKITNACYQPLTNNTLECTATILLAIKDC